MDAQKTKRREWVKTAAIILLAVLLVLTFFSNTIMNRSLPEVATETAQSGSINARIRGTGTVSANETYSVTIPQTKKVRTILVKTGDVVQAGDVLFVLEPMDSTEMEEAKKLLEEMELAYEKRLVELGNTNSTEDRELQKLQEAYNQALAVYKMYSNEDPAQLKLQAEKVKSTLAAAEADLSEAQAALEQVGKALSEAESELADSTAKLDATNADILKAEAAKEALVVYNRDWHIYKKEYQELQMFAKQNESAEASEEVLLAVYGKDPLLANEALSEDEVKQYTTAYSVITTNADALKDALFTLDPSVSTAFSTYDVDQYLSLTASTLYHNRSQYEQIARNAEQAIALMEDRQYRMQLDVDQAQYAVTAQQKVLDTYTDALNAADTLDAAEEALQDKMFANNLGSTEALDLQAQKEALDKQRELVEKLNSDDGGQEVTANVSGTVSEILCSAGTTVGADTPMATITVTDRGYTIKLSVTTEQARKVQQGDTAMISNYYSGDVTATLETIANDPQSMGKNKFLVFRLTGDVEPGASMTLSIGQKSANYDCLVPNSALRTDANGSFVLVVQAKSSPLGNRYSAMRVDVQVLAADDTHSAVSGLSAGDFVVTTSSRPIEAGDQIRLVDEG